MLGSVLTLSSQLQLRHSVHYNLHMKIDTLARPMLSPHPGIGLLKMHMQIHTINNKMVWAKPETRAGEGGGLVGWIVADMIIFDMRSSSSSSLQ